MGVILDSGLVVRLEDKLAISRMHVWEVARKVYVNAPGPYIRVITTEFVCFHTFPRIYL